MLFLSDVGNLISGFSAFSKSKLYIWPFSFNVPLKSSLKDFRSSLVAQTVKCLSTMWETQVQALGWEDPLEKEMAIYSSTIAWKIPWTEEPVRLQSMGSQRVRHN